MTEEKELSAHPNFYLLVDLIIDKTYSKKDAIISNLRLNYLLAENDNEKDKITKELKIKTKKKISKCKGEVHDFVFSALHYSDYFYDDTSYVSDAVNELVYYNITLEELNKLTNEDLLSYDSLKATKYYFLKPFLEYVKYIPLVELYHTLTLLEEDKKDKNYETLEKQKVQWYGTQTELIELIKSLIENNNFRGTQKQIIKKISVLFGLNINNPDKLIQDIKKRNVGSEALFLDRLKSSLHDFINK